MRYLVNVHGTVVNCPDIRKNAPWDEDKYIIWHLDDDLYNRSESLKAAIRIGLIVDVTDAILNLQQQGYNIEEISFDNLVPQPVNFGSFATQEQIEATVTAAATGQNIKQEYKTPEGMPSPYVMPKAEKPIMVDELTTSRALEASDGEAHKRASTPKYRSDVMPKDRGILVDTYDSIDLMNKVEESKLSHIVEPEDRSMPVVDPRLNGNSKPTAQSQIPIQTSKSTFTPKYSEKLKLNPQIASDLINKITTAVEANNQKRITQAYRNSKINDGEHDHLTQHKHDEDWWKNSVFARERKAEQMRKMESHHASHKHGSHDEVDERILYNNAMSEDIPNPLLQQLLSDEDMKSAPEVNLDVNPILAGIVEDESQECKQTIVSSFEEKPEVKKSGRGRKRSKK